MNVKNALLKVAKEDLVKVSIIKELKSTLGAFNSAVILTVETY